MKEIVFEPMTAHVTCRMERSYNEQFWRNSLSIFFKRLVQKIKEADAVLIGHIKGYAAFEENGFLKISTTGTHEPPDIQGGIKIPVKKISMTLNVLVYGITKNRLAELLEIVATEKQMPWTNKMNVYLKPNLTQ